MMVETADTKSMEYSLRSSTFLFGDDQTDHMQKISSCKDLEKEEIIFELPIMLEKADQFERDIYMNECRETKMRTNELESKIKEMDEQFSETLKIREECISITQDKLLSKEAEVVAAKDGKLEAFKQAEVMATALKIEKQKTEELEGHVSAINETIVCMQLAAMEAEKERNAVVSEKQDELVLAMKLVTEAQRELEIIRNHQSRSRQAIEKELVEKNLIIGSLQMELCEANDLHNLAKKATSEAVNDINQLIADMEQLVSENSNKGVHTKFLEMELNQLKHDYKNANEEVEHLHKEVEIAKKDVKRLSKDIETRNKDIERLDKEGEVVNKDRERLYEAVKIANNDVECLYKDVEISNKEIERLNKDVDIANKDRERLNKDVEIANDYIGRLLKDVEDANKEIERLNKEVGSAHIDIERLHKDVKTFNKDVDIAYKNDVDDLNKEVEMLTCNIASIKNELDEIRGKEIEARSEIALLKSEIHEGRSKTATAEAAEERSRLENQSICLNVQQLESKAKEANEEIKRLREEADKRTGTLGVTDRSVTISVEEYKALVGKANKEDEVRETTDKLVTLKKDLDIATARIGEFRARAEQAAFRAEAAEKGKAALEEHIQRSREQREKRKMAHQAFKEASITPKFNYKQDLGLPPKTHQPLGKVLNMKF